MLTPTDSRQGATHRTMLRGTTWEVDTMITVFSVIAIVVAGLPFAAIVLVTVASRREDDARSMAGQAPGQLARVARRLLGFHAQGFARPQSRAQARAASRSLTRL
jgi:hypothetical protein